MPRHIPGHCWCVHGIKLQDQSLTFWPSLSQMTPGLGRADSKAWRNQLFPFQKRHDGINCVKLRSEQPPENFIALYNFMCRSNIPTVVNPELLSLHDRWEIDNLKERLSGNISLWNSLVNLSGWPRLDRKGSDEGGYWTRMSWVLYCHNDQCIVLASLQCHCLGAVQKV